MIASEKAPPLWGNSFWWTRAGALLGLASLLFSLAMTSGVGVHIGSCGLRNQLTDPTLAIEVAADWDDVLKIVGPCEAPRCLQSEDAQACFPGGICQTICPDKVRALAFEQTLDYGFIIVYWLFFAYLAFINFKFCSWERFPLATQTIGKVCAAATLIAGTLGARADWHENGQILQALSELHVISGLVPVMRDFAYAKWRLLFLAMGTSSPIFIFWPGKSNLYDARRSVFSQLLAWSASLLALSTAWTGVAAHIYGDDQRLEIAAKRLGLVIVFTMLTLATAQFWRGGTMSALDRLAKLPLLRFFPTLFSSEVDAPQNPDNDPSRML